MYNLSREEAIVVLKFIKMHDEFSTYISPADLEAVLTEYHQSIGEVYDHSSVNELSFQELTLYRTQYGREVDSFDYVPKHKKSTPFTTQTANTQVVEHESFQPNPTSKAGRAGKVVALLSLASICTGVFYATAFGGRKFETVSNPTPTTTATVKEPVTTIKPTPEVKTSPKPTVDKQKSTLAKTPAQERVQEIVKRQPRANNNPPPVQGYERDAGMNNPDYQPPVRTKKPKVVVAPERIVPQIPPVVAPTQPEVKPPVVAPAPTPPVVIDSPPPVVIDTPPPVVIDNPPVNATPPDVVVPTEPVAPLPKTKAIDPDIKQLYPGLNAPGNEIVLKNDKT